MCAGRRKKTERISDRGGGGVCYTVMYLQGMKQMEERGWGRTVKERARLLRGDPGGRVVKRVTLAIAAGEERSARLSRIRGLIRAWRS